MRILCVTPWFPSHRHDQRGNFILDSVEALIELGHEVVVLVTEAWRPKNWPREMQRIEEFSHQFKSYSCYCLSVPRGYFCSFSNWAYRVRVNPMIEKLVRQYQCQLIHAHTELSGVSAVDVGRKIGVPTVVTLHGISTEKNLYSGATKKLFYDYGMTAADRVVLVGDPLVRFFSNMIKKNNHFRVVPNGFRVNLAYEKNSNKVWGKKLGFISVSNLVEGKGIDINLYAFAKLKHSGITDWTYNIIGDGEEKKNLIITANKLGLNNHINFLGACNHKEVYRHLIQSDIFVLPSYREAFGIAYLEAMSCELLTIGIEGQGVQAFIEHGKTGLLIPPNNADALTETFKKIFELPEQMQKIANAGKNHVHHYFTWNNHAKGLIDVYKEIIND